MNDAPKRQELTLGYINKGLYEDIPAKDVREGSKRIKEFMTPHVRDFIRNEALSKRHAKTKIVRSFNNQPT